MKFRISVLELSNAVQSISGAARDEDDNEFLGHVIFTAQADGTLGLLATDNERAAGTVITTDVIRPGRGTASVPRLLGLLRLLDRNATVELIADDGFLTLFAPGSRRFRFRSLDLFFLDQDFPRPADPVLRCDPSELLKAIESTRFAVAPKSQKRIALTGLLFELKDEEIKLTATDSVRLAHTTLPADGHGGDLEVLLPAESVRVLRSWLKLCSKPVAISASAQNLHLACGPAWFFSQLISERYPDWRSLLTGELDLVCSVGRADLSSALSQVVIAAVSSEKKGPPRSSLDLGDSTLTLSANVVDDSAVVEIGANNNTDPGPVGDFNPKLLRQAIDALDGKFVDLSRSGHYLVARSPGEPTLHLLASMKPEVGPEPENDG